MGEHSVGNRHRPWVSYLVNGFCRWPTHSVLSGKEDRPLRTGQKPTPEMMGRWGGVPLVDGRGVSAWVAPNRALWATRFVVPARRRLKGDERIAGILSAPRGVQSKGPQDQPWRTLLLAISRSHSLRRQIWDRWAEPLEGGGRQRTRQRITGQERTTLPANRRCGPWRFLRRSRQ